jgi:hypothetical protein
VLSWSYHSRAIASLWVCGAVSLPSFSHPRTLFRSIFHRAGSNCYLVGSGWSLVGDFPFSVSNSSGLVRGYSWIASSRITFELELSPSNNGDWSPQISLTDQLRTYQFSTFGVLLADLLYRKSSPSQLSTLERSSNKDGRAGCRRLMPQLSNKESTMRPIFPTMLPVQTTVIGVHGPRSSPTFALAAHENIRRHKPRK